MKQEIKIEVAQSKCKKTPSDKEFNELLETKRNNQIPKEIELNLDNNK